jgi:DNA polymerase IIIc chi subunit
MTAQVHFLSIPDHKQKIPKICEEVESSYQKQQRVMIWTTQEYIASIDHSLWTFSAESFLPHAIWPCPLTLHPIVISTQRLLLADFHILIIDSQDIQHSDLEWIIHYPKIIEFADLSSEQSREQSRNRYRIWLNHQIKPVYEKISA